MDYILPTIILICLVVIIYGLFRFVSVRSKYLEMKILSDELARKISEEETRDKINRMSIHDITRARNDKRDPTK